MKLNVLHIRSLLLLLLLVVLVPIQAQSQTQAPIQPLTWPEITQQNKPWTRWWWMGSSVDEANLTRSLELYEEAGLGGVEITPIYGVAGHEEQFIPYLTPEWMERLVYTLGEASRLGLGVDMATGTGWPFGGPHVEKEDASRYVAHKTYTLLEGKRLEDQIQFEQKPILRAVGNSIMPDPTRRQREIVKPDIDKLVEPVRDNDDLQSLALDQVRFSTLIPLQVLMAYSDTGEAHELTNRVDVEGRLDWTAPAGNWTLYAVFQGWHGKMVERAAPGGEGYAINHFSDQALQNYLKPFNDAFAGYDISALRGFFNDSYEVDDANGEADWTPAFFEAFEARRGYDLRMHLPALFGNDTPENNRRVRTDHRQTLSELLLDEFTQPWTQWAHMQGALTRNQAHGSPANILDLYAATDIPETESTDMMRIKFASSAAHVTGKQLTSAEAATWLNEHFQSNWADVKKAVDRFFLGGVNHIVYHGTSYSPVEAPWPGWLFYAAVHFSPQNPLWEDFSVLNDYVARVQSILQAGSPANEVLLYLPLQDRFAKEDPSMLVHFHGLDPFEGMPVQADADWLQEHGFAFDFISDLQLQTATPVDGQIETVGAMYETVVVPAAQSMPLATVENLLALAKGGATIVFHQQLPEDVPGLGNHEARKEALEGMIDGLQFTDVGSAGIKGVNFGSGRLLLGDDLESLLAEAGVQREKLVDEGLAYIKRSRTSGTDYFITNWGEQMIDGWVPLNAEAQLIAIFDPGTGKTGLAAKRNGDSEGTEVYLQLMPGESLVLRTFDTGGEGESFAYFKPAGDAKPLDGIWQVEFTSGGPELPPNTTLEHLVSWTEFAGDRGKSFAGTGRYTINFSVSNTVDAFKLDLGEVHETARITLNGEHLETRIGPTYHVIIDGAALQRNNVLTIDVSNLMANRIADMDQQQVPWKKFYNINFPSRLPENRNAGGLFDATQWQPASSGLLGPVTLTPMKKYTP